MMQLHERKRVLYYRNETEAVTIDIVQIVVQDLGAPPTADTMLSFPPSMPLATRNRIVGKHVKEMLDAKGDVLQDKSPEAPKTGPKLVGSEDPTGQP